MKKNYKTLDKLLKIVYNVYRYPCPYRTTDEIQEEVFYMAKLSAKYEVMVVFSMKNGEENVKALVEKFKSLMEKNATVEDVNEWGKRKLAYEIDDQTEGYYVLYTFESKPDFPAELDRVFKITEGVMRSMIIVK